MTMPTEGDGGWRGLAFWGAIATTVVIVIMAFVAEILLLLISAALFAIGAVLIRRRGNGGPILLGIVALLFLLTDGPFLVPYLRVPASWTNFILACFLLLGSLVILIAAIGAFRRRDAGSGPRVVAGVAIVLAVVSVGVAAAAGVTYDQPTAKPGDLRMAARDIKFSRANLEASAGSISVFLTNQDTVLHTFTIDRLNVNLNIPASSTARVTFAATPGTYRYICTLHSDMHGVLTVR